MVQILLDLDNSHSYVVYSGNEGHDVIVGVRFSEFNSNCPLYATYKGYLYRRENIEILPYHLINTFCSMRKFVVVDAKG
jgi:hypothetical protein